MGNPLLTFWSRRVQREEQERRARRARALAAAESAGKASETVFLVLRRMRAPLIVLVSIFSISVLGLTLIPGVDDGGRPFRMGFFDAIYVMSYTATTIGFGEIPYEFTYNQRMWVTISIYLTVVGWAYAIGSLLSLLQDRSFRQALAMQRFSRRVARLAEPFVLIAGFGRAGELLGHSMDRLGRRVVVLDIDSERIEGLDLETFRVDVPGLTADARDPGHLGVAGLDHPCCEAVVALTNDDEANLAVVMATTLLRPDLPVIARATTRTMTDRMRVFGSPSVVNPFDVFGDHLRLALRAPASYQLLTWLEAGPGAPLPDRGSPPRTGRWIVCGYGRLGRELTRDLQAEGIEVTVVDATPHDDVDDAVLAGGFEPDVLHEVGLEQAAGFVAGTDNDITNLSLAATARATNPALFVAARQNRPSSAPLFAAMELDALLVPTEVVAHQVYAQLSTPLLWRFVQEMPALGDEWAADLVDRLIELCGEHLQALWKLRLTPEEAPALTGWLASGQACLGDLLRNPEDREERLHAVVLLVLRGRDATLAPGPDFVLAPGDEVLLVGWPAARRALDTVLVVDAVREYVATGRRVPAGWVWRKISGVEPQDEPVGR